MSRIKEFLKENGIKQKELAAYLGVTEPSVSRMVNGVNNPSEDNLRKIMENPYGWDTSMLQDGMTMSASAHGIANTASIKIGGNEEAYKIKIEHLESLLKQSEARCEQYWNMIQDLIKKLGHE